MENLQPKPFVFVLMPFDSSFDDVYSLGIKPACEEAGGFCERVDEQIYNQSILTQVYDNIFKADLIVGDMTGRNPNVFYEVGYAHALGKTVILLTKKSEDIPFDLKHYPHIIHNGRIMDLRNELIRRVEWYLKNQNTNLQVAVTMSHNVKPDEQSPSVDIEKLMPELLDEMTNDLRKTPICLEFILLKKAWVYNGDGHELVYWYDEHEDLDNKIIMLENLKLIRDITYSNVKRYVIEHHFWRYLMNRK